MEKPDHVMQSTASVPEKRVTHCSCFVTANSVSLCTRWKVWFCTAELVRKCRMFHFMNLIIESLVGAIFSCIILKVWIG